MTASLQSNLTTGDRSSGQGAADILIAARKLIEKPENWSRKPICGAHCAQTAIRNTVSCFDDCRPALQLFAEAAAIHDYTSITQIWAWNDALDRTHSEVLAAFDRAIELAIAKATGAA